MASMNALLPDQDPAVPVTAPPANALLPAAGVNSADAYTSTLGAVSDWVAKQRADAAARGLWDEASGMPTSAGWLDALHQYGGALVAGTASSGGRGAPVAGQAAFDFSAPAVASDAASAGVGAAAAADVGVGGAPVNALAAAPPRVPSIVAYHGSGADFPAFNDQYIGSGEGAQAYGYGHYVAGNEGVARGYRDAMAGRLSPADEEAMADASSRERQALSALRFLPERMQQESMEHPDYQPTIEPDGTPVVNTAIHPDVAAKYQPQVASFEAQRDAARADINAIQVRTGPTVGGVPYDSNDPVHRTAGYLDRYGGDPARTLSAIDDEIAKVQRNSAGWNNQAPYVEAERRLNEMKPLLAPGAPALPAFKTPGHMYEVGIHDDPGAFLDWDKPLSQQSPVVREALESMGAVPDATGQPVGGNSGPTGAEIHQQLVSGMQKDLRDQTNAYENASHYLNVEHGGDHAAALAGIERELAASKEMAAKYRANGLSTNGTHYDVATRRFEAARDVLLAHPDGQFSAEDLPDPAMAPMHVAGQLNDAGIAGIRYLDGGSRRAGEGTHNHVVFDPRTMEILRKYGVAGLAVGGAAAGANQQPGAPQ